MRNKILIASFILVLLVGILLINNSYSINEEEQPKGELTIKLNNIREVEEINEKEGKDIKDNVNIPTINNNKVDNINFSFQNPGDYLSFIFDIENTSIVNGEIAKININNIKCNGEYSEEELESICKNISVDMMYNNSNKEVKEGNVLFAGSTMPINVMIIYNNGPDTKEDINVSITDLNIEFEFKESN